MKVISVLSVIMLILGISCTTKVNAEHGPVISKKYTNGEINKMIQSHETNYSSDVRLDESVNNKFKSDFPQAKDIDWEIAADIYQVEFEIGFVDYEAYYDRSGELIKYSFECKRDALPALVINSVIAKYPDYDFEDMKKIISGSLETYKIELEKKNIDVTLLLSADGTILSEWFD